MTPKELQDKQAFFALYYDQQVLRFNTWNESNYITELDGSVHRGHKVRPDFAKVSYLELKSLADIADEDVIEVAKMLGYDKFHSKGKDIGEVVIIVESTLRGDGRDTSIYIDKNGVNILSNTGDWEGCNYEKTNNIQVIDYLRSQGYLLPFRGMSCEELIAKGWIKIKES